MLQTPIAYCDCCDLPVGPQAEEDCPRCHYPVSPPKEARFLETSLRDLKRVATYDGANLTVSGLIQRYSLRLNLLREMQAGMIATPSTQTQIVMAPVPQPPVIKLAPPDTIPVASTMPTALFVHQELQGTQPGIAALPAAPAVQRAPRPVFSLSSFLADQTINIVASLGAFLILIGALGFIATTTNLLLSFGVFFAVHALFGIVGFSTYRFRTFRVVAIIYTVIYALLVPLVGFAGYRLIEGHVIVLPVPTLVAIAATYAAIVYSILAVYQSFKPFGYLGGVALAIADLAVADSLHLAYWWWPSILLLLAFPALVSVASSWGNPRSVSVRLFAGSFSILREPVRMLMVAIVASGVVAGLIITIDALPMNAAIEIRFSLLSLLSLLLVWVCCFLSLAKRTKELFVIPYLFLACVLAFCYAFDFPQVGYVLALTAVALLYHGLSRFAAFLLAPLGDLNVQLDILALLLVAIVPFISNALLPLQLLTRVYAPSLFHYHTSWETVAGLVAVGLGFLLTLNTALRGVKRPWLILLSGLLFNWAYATLVLTLNIEPIWCFLGLALVSVALAVVVRQRFGASWSHPLDVLALGELLLTLLLHVNQNPDRQSALLLFFAALLYAVLLYQHRHNLLFLPLLFALFALPILLATRPYILFLLGLLLPFASVIVRRLLTAKIQPAAGLTAQMSFANVSTRVQRLVILWEWPLVTYALLCGILLAANDVSLVPSSVQLWLGVPFPAALEISALALAWYASAALARTKSWLLPVIGFATGALLLSSNPFWVLVGVTSVAALLAVGVGRIASKSWAVPLYFVALLGGIITGYVGQLQHHWAEVILVLLAFAAIAYAIGIVEDLPIALWIAPLFATWSIYNSAALLHDLYRPPVVALICAGVAVAIGCLRFTTVAHFIQKSKLLTYALPFYATALAAAILTGIYGTFTGVNYPFDAAVPDAILLYALVAYVVLLFERRPGWLWLVAGFASWAVYLALQTMAYYVVGIGIGAGLLGLVTGLVFKRRGVRDTRARSRQALAHFTWSWPWYVTMLVAAFATIIWPYMLVSQPGPHFLMYGLFAFAALTFLTMLVERVPEALLFPVLLATCAIGQSALALVPLMISYSLLCIGIFVTQFVWSVISPATHRLPATSLHKCLSLGGLTLVLLVIILQGGLSADSGNLIHVGAASLLVLALLIFWSGHLQKNLTVRRYCEYGAGLVLALVISWELVAFRQTSLELLLLAPSSYLTVLAPFLMRDKALPERHRLGQIVSLLGAALLLLPILQLSLSENNLLPTSLLAGEALALLLLGIATRMRIFVLSGAALVVVAGLRTLFLPTLGLPPSLALTVLGVTLLLIATGLSLARHRLRVVWTNWE